MYLDLTKTKLTIPDSYVVKYFERCGLINLKLYVLEKK